MEKRGEGNRFHSQWVINSLDLVFVHERLGMQPRMHPKESLFLPDSCMKNDTSQVINSDFERLQSTRFLWNLAPPSAPQSQSPCPVRSHCWSSRGPKRPKTLQINFQHWSMAAPLEMLLLWLGESKLKIKYTPKITIDKKKCLKRVSFSTPSFWVSMLVFGSVALPQTPLEVVKKLQELLHDLFFVIVFFSSLSFYRGLWLQ